MYRYTKITRFHRRTHPERRVYHAHGLQILISLKPACSRSSNHIAARRIIPPLREGWYLCPPLQTRVVHRGSSPEGGLVLFAEGWRMPPWYSNLGALVLTVTVDCHVRLYNRPVGSGLERVVEGLVEQFFSREVAYSYLVVMRNRL